MVSRRFWVKMIWNIFSRGLEIKHVGGLKMPLELSTRAVNDDRVVIVKLCVPKLLVAKPARTASFTPADVGHAPHAKIAPRRKKQGGLKMPLELSTRNVDDDPVAMGHAGACRTKPKVNMAR